MAPMVVRRALALDWPRIVSLARECGLDYAGMEADEFWVAEEAGRVLGIVALKTHAECRELCALGVDAAWRGRGIGARLVRHLLGGVDGDVYLATVIPEFFERLGFERSVDVPRSLVKDAAWCVGCRRELCVVMVRRAS
jgi:N-acetylglutamate synthase-like GNAT family acetyltransferase